eukprot:6183628-Pleurochrysis_carterae.AAC.1
MRANLSAKAPKTALVYPVKSLDTLKGTQKCQSVVATDAGQAIFKCPESVPARAATSRGRVAVAYARSSRRRCKLGSRPFILGAAYASYGRLE